MARSVIHPVNVLTKSFILRLPNNLHKALIAIHTKSDDPLPAEDIKKLLLANFIDHDIIRGGWRTNSKGREYLKWHSQHSGRL
jgi:hypothetical protein